MILSVQGFTRIFYVWIFSQLQYRKKNQNFILNFTFQFIEKKRNGTLGTRILHVESNKLLSFDGTTNIAISMWDDINYIFLRCCHWCIGNISILSVRFSTKVKDKQLRRISIENLLWPFPNILPKMVFI